MANRRSNMVKPFLATYRPADGLIRVVIVQEDHGGAFFFCTDHQATPREIIETFADRAAIEPDLHDVKEVWRTGQQQVRNIGTNVAVFPLNLWVPPLVECWAWHQPAKEIGDRSDSPWDDADRRPSRADRRNALRRRTQQNAYSSFSAAHRRSWKIRGLHERLLPLVAYPRPVFRTCSLCGSQPGRNAHRQTRRMARRGRWLAFYGVGGIQDDLAARPWPLACYAAFLVVVMENTPRTNCRGWASNQQPPILTNATPSRQT